MQGSSFLELKKNLGELNAEILQRISFEDFKRMNEDKYSK